MINLLPPSRAESIRYGRQNATLRKWIFGALIAIGGLVVIVIAGWVYMDEQSKNLQKDIALTNQQLKAQNLESVQKDAKEISGDVQVINKILSQEIRFSELIKAIAGIMPPGTELGTMSLSNKVSGGIDIIAKSQYGSSVSLIVANLTDPQNQLFSKADVISVSCDPKPTEPFPCTVNLRALFSKTAQGKFISFPAGGS
ncbi:hypothetical protein KW792_01185 [Candidatus Saccharibacteria bacterium]|nr:hypothetical protein [Candidatus Saccharibacteria bacterium]